MMRRVAVVVVVVLWAQAVWAQLLFRNSGGVPYLASQGSAWSSGQCLVVDASGETATFGSCSAGTGDITDVWSCSTGNCSTLTAAAGDSLDCGSADSCSPMPRSTTLPGTCTEGQMYQDTDSGGAELYVCTAANTWTSVGGGGSGDVTDVGPGCATGACLTDGVATTGSTLLMWEGTTVNTAEFQISVPSDPSSDITWTVPNSAATITFPSGTQTLATLDGSETLTNKTLTTPTIASFTNATHAHQSAAGGGTLDAAAIASGTLAVARGGTNQSTVTDDGLLVANGTTFQLKTLTDCDDTGGNHLNYDTATNAFSCGTSGGAGGGAPTTAQYVTMALDGTLSAERVLTAGTAMDLSDTGANGTAVFDWDSTEVGTTTFGSGSGIVWTFDASAGTDAAITFGNGTVNVSTGTLQHAGSAVVDVGDTGTVTGTMIANATIGYADVDATDTLSTAARGANAIWFGTTGLIFEGSNNDGVELLVTAADPTTSDKTITFPNTTGTVVTTGDSGTVTSTMIANSTITSTDMDMTSTYSFSAGGLVVPTNTAATCATGTLEGSTCWATDTDKLYMGTSSAMKILVDTDSTQTLSSKTLSTPTISGATTATYTDSSTSGLPAMSTWTQTMAPGSASTSLNLGNAFISDYNTTTNSTGGALLVGVYAKSIASNTGDISSLAALYAQVGTTNAGATCTNCYGLYVADSSATGTNTNDYAIYTAGTEKLQFGGPVVYAAGSQAIAAATNTFTCTTGYLKFTTATGTTVMTSNPTIADGTTGQVCRLENVDATATDCVTFPDGTTGLQLGAARTLCPNDTLVVIYDGTDWVELSQANN